MHMHRVVQRPTWISLYIFVSELTTSEFILTVFFPNKIWSRKTPVREIIPVMTILNATPILAECLRIKPPCYINYADVFALFNVF